MGALLSSAAALALGLSAAADRLQRYPELGLALELPARLEPRQVPPEEAELLLLHAPADAPADRIAPLTQRVYRVEGRGLEAAELEAWVGRRFRSATVEPARAVRSRFGRSPLRLEGTHVVNDEERSLFVHAWVGAGDTVVFVGECAPRLLRRERRTFERVAGSFRFFEPVETERVRARWEQRYRRTRLSFVEERVAVAAALAEGWSVTDTEEAIVLFHGADRSPVPDGLARALTAIRRRLASDFPGDRPIDTLAVVRVCRDRGEYLTHGGSPATVGYFNPNVGELVIYDSRTVREGAVPMDHPTVRTLFHEACHQYLHQVTGGAAPHTWFGEGLAEYYAGAKVVDGRVVSVDPLEGPRALLARAEVRGGLPALATLLTLDQEGFYADAARCYPQSYGLVRFLLTAGGGAQRPEWEGLVRRYHDTLRRAWRAEGERSESARARARSAALAAALEGVRLEELERAVTAWMAGSGG